ncbi:glutathione S-transferase [Bimuria novae-zelandiae CBS 107.79]|uniref:glutathione transferase n=1 Tax=Bimuria novae-zelandiae CBS 107.79 TaxID=1447943 RepID=A0A6A5UKX8_9PLEO|nr:glutathione S-transferase [Bimuria novae-zelandiae CBS 107.79]
MLPIKVHITPAGPNSWKPILVLAELGLPYELQVVSDVKQKPFTDINPNGRVPAIEDPNTDLVLWESGAIIQYIIEHGQGPYFVQAAWFNHLHPEKIPSAMAWYSAKLNRILSVLEGVLEGKQWLVGDKMTFADLAFSVWNERIDALISCKPEEKFDRFPNVEAWHERMTGRVAWKSVMAERAKIMDAQNLGTNE